MEEAGKGGGLGQKRPLSRGSSEVSVGAGARLSIENEEGQRCHGFVSTIRWMVYFCVCGGGLVVQCEQRKSSRCWQTSCGFAVQSIHQCFDPVLLFKHFA